MKLLQSEKIILQNLDKRWKFIFRTANDGLYVSDSLPSVGHVFEAINFPFQNLFKFIKSEAYSIENLLSE